MGISVHIGIETGNEHIEQHTWGHTCHCFSQDRKMGRPGSELCISETRPAWQWWAKWV